MLLSRTGSCLKRRICALRLNERNSLRSPSVFAENIYGNKNACNTKQRKFSKRFEYMGTSCRNYSSTSAERLSLAVQAAIGAFIDPKRADHVAALGEITGLFFKNYCTILKTDLYKILQQ